MAPTSAPADLGWRAGGHQRAYRWLPSARPTVGALAALLVVGFEGALLWLLEPATTLFVRVAVALMRAVDVPVGLALHPFLGAALPVPVFPVGAVSHGAALAWLVGAAAGALLLGALRWPAPPLRYLAIVNLAILASSGGYLLLYGDLGHDAEAFSRLLLSTVVLLWLVIPPFMTLVALGLPFSALERVLVVGTCLAYDALFSLVRYAVFAWLLGALGSVVAANLYLVLGPVLDFVLCVGVFTAFLLRLARRLGRTPGAWA